MTELSRCQPLAWDFRITKFSADGVESHCALHENIGWSKMIIGRSEYILCRSSCKKLVQNGIRCGIWKGQIIIIIRGESVLREQLRGYEFHYMEIRSIGA